MFRLCVVNCMIAFAVNGLVRLAWIRFLRRASAMSPSSLALSNLRAIVIVIVLGFHSMLAYLVWTPIAAATDFAVPP